MFVSSGFTNHESWPFTNHGLYRSPRSAKDMVLEPPTMK